MKFFLGVTDFGWFQQLRLDCPSEVNFWFPSASVGFKFLIPGQPFLFKLHSPRNYIVGGGYFAGFSVLPVSMAWDAFGRNNGVTSREELESRIKKYRGSASSNDPEIGCVILNDPFFFDEQEWIPQPSDWSSNIVRGKGYDMYHGIGGDIWNAIQSSLRESQEETKLIRELSKQKQPVYGKEYLQKARLGQGTFRVLTLQNYSQKCCITGENTVPVLQAAHIQPVHREGDHMLNNGLLMRADIHILFDKGLIGIDSDYRIRISPQIREHYLNGKVYYAHDGAALRSLPEDMRLQPDRNLLDQRMSELFIA